MNPGFRPIVAGHDGGTRPPVRADRAQTIDHPCAPIAGGWMVQSGDPIYIATLSVRTQVRPGSTGLATVMTRPVPLPNNLTAARSAGQTRFAGVSIQYTRVSSATLTLSLNAIERSTGITSQIKLWDNSDFTATSSGVYATFAELTNYTLDPVTYEYYMRLYLFASSSASDVGVSAMFYKTFEQGAQ